ncbi:hypothetical protein KQI84_00530 [bacterium]|nr:hypothetical protein [bacterium]
MIAFGFVVDAWKRNAVPILLLLIYTGFQTYLLRLPLDWMPLGRMEMPVMSIYLYLLAGGLFSMGVLLIEGARRFLPPNRANQVAASILAGVLIAVGTGHIHRRRGHRLLRRGRGDFLLLRRVYAGRMGIE